VDSEDAFDQAERRLSTFLRTNPQNLIDLFDQTNQRWRIASIATVRNRVRDGFATGTESLIKLADTSAEDLSCREAIKQAMAHVKGWATSTMSTRPNFDCRAGVIDLAVIDEASQCNLAQVLPLAYRAKRLVIVGDPQQLSPVVTANAEELRALAIAAGTSHDTLAAAHLTYGEDSAYTAFAARFRPAPLLLDEHFRCHPEIIRYCNQHFYDNKLKILTSVNREGDPPRGLEWHEVVGRTEPGRTGSALNEAEADAVVTWVLEKYGRPPDRLGVVTPFRAQAARIRDLLEQRGQGQFDAVRVGTAHTFQGGECDTVVFSTVISTGAMPGTVAWLEGERNLINVAVSRARHHLVVFGNRAELRRAGATTLLSLATAAEGLVDQPETATPATNRLHAALVASGLPASLGEVDEGYPLAITLTAVNGDRIDIEVDDFPDGDPRGRGQRQLATRDANVQRLGWQVLRIPGWQAYLDPDAVAEQVRQLVTR